MNRGLVPAKLMGRTKYLRRSRSTFEGNGGAQSFAILADGRHGDNSAIREVANHSLARLEVALDLRSIPVACMADIPNCSAVVSAPEERRIMEGFLLAQHVASHDLSLPLRHHPVFDANAFAGDPVRPLRRVSRGINTRGAGFKVLVDQNPVTCCYSRLHILPNVMSHVIVAITLAIPSVVLLESFLGFLGFAVKPPLISWGLMLQDTATYSVIGSYPWIGAGGCRVDYGLCLQRAG